MFSFLLNGQNEKHRLVILADMGNEPDEEQQMVHMLMCSNEFEIEGLIAVTGIWLKSHPQPELFFKLIDGYETVYPNLNIHAKGWPESDYLRKITKSGQPGYGIANVGEGKSSPGSRLLESILMKKDPRPVWIVINAGSNTLAQALLDLEKNVNKEQLQNIISKMRVFENGAQDNSGAWICHRFPTLHWIRSNYQTYAYGGPRKNLGPNVWYPFDSSAQGQHLWAKQHIQNNHGELGSLYPDRYFNDLGFIAIEGGGTIPWMGLLNKGLFHIDQPAWGGWSGRFTREKQLNPWSKYYNRVRPDELKYSPFYMYVDTLDTWTDANTGVTYSNNYTPVWRWREAMFNDFRSRMDWCVKTYTGANHHPVAVVGNDNTNQIIRINADAGDELVFNAAHSYDPDGDSLSFYWYPYHEAGTYKGAIKLGNPRDAETTLIIPAASRGKSIHIILEVTDDNVQSKLYDYRRIIITVTSS